MLSYLTESLIDLRPCRCDLVHATQFECSAEFLNDLEANFTPTAPKSQSPRRAGQLSCRGWITYLLPISIQYPRLFHSIKSKSEFSIRFCFETWLRLPFETNRRSDRMTDWLTASFVAAMFLASCVYRCLYRCLCCCFLRGSNWTSSDYSKAEISKCILYDLLYVLKKYKSSTQKKLTPINVAMN